MSVNFPEFPVAGITTYNFNGRTWKYNGDGWELVPQQYPTGSQGVQGIQGTQGVIGSPGISATGRIYWFHSSTSDYPNSEELIPDFPSSLTTDDMFATVTSSSGPVAISTHVTQIGDPNLSAIPAGEYEFRVYRYVSSNAGVSTIRFQVFGISTDVTPIETTLFEVSTGEINETTATYQSVVGILTAPIPFNVDHRVGIRAFAETSSATPIDVHFVHDGSNTQSSVRTAITQGFVGPQGVQGVQGLSNQGVQGLQGQLLTNIPQNSQTTSYTLVASDSGKHISITTGGVTVPQNVFSIGDVITIFNNSGSNQTITQDGGTTLRFAATSLTGNRTLSQYGVCNVLCYSSNNFVISGAGLT